MEIDVLGHFPNGLSLDRQFFNRKFPKGQFPEEAISQMEISPRDSSLSVSLNHIFFIYLNLNYHWYTKVVKANEFQKYIYIYIVYIDRYRERVNEILTTKLIYLQIKHLQSIFPKFLLKLK